MHDAKCKEEKFGCFWIGLCVLLIVLGVKWLVLGEISIPYQGIQLTGISARFVALLWIMFCMQPIWSAAKKRRH